MPIGAILFAQFVLLRREPIVEDLYRDPGPYTVSGGCVPAGCVAWAAGAVTYYLTANIGATLPTLLVSVLTHTALSRWLPRRPLKARRAPCCAVGSSSLTL